LNLDALKNETENEKNTLVQYYNDFTEDIKDKMDRMHNEATSMRYECDKILKNYRKEMNTITRTLKQSELSIVQVINSVGNTNKEELESINKSANATLQQVQAANKIGKASVTSVNSLLTKLRDSIAQHYNKFEDDLMMKADDEKEKFRMWIANQCDQHEALMTTLEDIRKERELMKAERTLFEVQWKEQCKKFKQLEDKVNNMVQPSKIPSTHPTSQHQSSTPSIKLHQNDQQDISPIKATSTNEVQNHTFQPPIPPDTLVRYKNRLSDFYGYIMDLNDPGYKNGTWYYDIFTAKGTSLYNCDGRFVTVINETVDNKMLYENNVKQTPRTNNSHATPTNNHQQSVQKGLPTYESPLKKEYQRQ
jgi:hypothetical protein